MVGEDYGPPNWHNGQLNSGLSARGNGFPPDEKAIGHLKTPGTRLSYLTSGDW